MISFFEFDSKRLRVDAYALNHIWSIHIAQIKWAEELFGRMGGGGGRGGKGGIRRILVVSHPFPPRR